MKDSSKNTALTVLVAAEMALVVFTGYHIVNYGEKSDVKHSRSSYVEQQGETFASNEFERNARDTAANNSYKISTGNQNVTIDAEAKYDDGTELTEADKELVAEILRQMLQNRAKSSKTFYAGGYGEVEDVNHLGGSCGYYRTSCCGNAYVCPRREGSVKTRDGTVYLSNGFNNRNNPSMKMGGTLSELSVHPSFSF